MRQILLNWFSFIFASCVLLSCSSPKEKEPPREDKTETQVNSNKAEASSFKETANPTAASPRIVRSALAPGYHKFTVDSNQVSQYIRSIFQDTQGNLWLGTVGEGTVRYDGNSLNYFSSLNGFGGNSVQAIREDNYGNLWFATSDGLTKYDGVKFTVYSEKDGLNSNSVLSLCIDRSGTIWIGTSEGICRFDGKNFNQFPIPGHGSNLEIQSIIQDKTGNMWFATKGTGVWRFDGTSLTNISTKDGLGDNFVSSILQDRTGKIWFAMPQKGLSYFDPAAGVTPGNGSFVTMTEKSSFDLKGAWRLYEDKSGKIWLTLRLKVYCFDGNSIKKFGAEDGLTNLGVQSYFEDKAGNFWLGSGAGLFRFDGTSFTNVTKKGPWPKRIR